MSETLTLRISGGLDAPSRARAAIGALDGSLGTRRDAVRLILTELIANCVRHSGAGPDTNIDVALQAKPEEVRVAVTCPGPGFDAKPRPRPEGGGLGLFIVDKMSKEWGIEGSHPATVWAVV
jgi:anti-sigma regulatory factor (Ser/Thr protein kinase)